jgi:replication-associated recombination protein RarA
LLTQLAQRSQSQGQLNTQPLSTVPRPQQLSQVTTQETMIQSKVTSSSVLNSDDSNLYDLLK